MYVCNCNGIRERDVRAAIAAGASRPAQIFKACDGAAQCARCVCDMRQILDEERTNLGASMKQEREQKTDVQSAHQNHQKIEDAAMAKLKPVLSDEQYKKYQ